MGGREKLSERGVAAVVGGVEKRHQRSARHGYDPELVGQFGRAHSSGLFVRHCVPSILRSKNVIIELPLLTTTSNVIACDNKRKMPIRVGERRGCVWRSKEKEVEGSPVMVGS